MKTLLLFLLCVSAANLEQVLSQNTDDLFADQGSKKVKPRPRATVSNVSFKEYREAVMKLKSMHEKKPFVSMEATVLEFFRIIGKNWDDLKLATGGTEWDEWDNIYQIKIGEEDFTLQMAGPIEREEDGLRSLIYKCDLIAFNVGQLDSPFAYETLWEWHAPSVEKNQKGNKEAEQGMRDDAR